MKKIFPSQLQKQNNIRNIYKSNKTIWITGASSGIGEDLAVRFSFLGAKKLILSSRNLKELDRVKQKCNSNCKIEIFQLDVSIPEEVLKKTKEFVLEKEKQNEFIDILVLNAGVAQRVPFEQLPFENHKYLNDVNYLGPTAHVKGVLDHLKKNPGSHIVYINSVSGKRPMFGRGSYCGSKFACTGFFDVLRAEVYQYQISVTQIYPGYTQTNVSKNAMGDVVGQPYGKTDANISKGMPLEKFGQKAIKAIFQRKNDQIIDNIMSHYIDIIFKDIFPDYIHKKNEINFQMK